MLFLCLLLAFCLTLLLLGKHEMIICVVAGRLLGLPAKNLSMFLSRVVRVSGLDDWVVRPI
jgi:hypothetical protein